MIKDFDLHNKMDERPNTDYRLYLCIIVSGEFENWRKWRVTSRQIGSKIPRRSGSISPKSLGSGGWVDFAMIRRRMINTVGSVAASSVDRRAKEFMMAMKV